MPRFKSGSWPTSLTEPGVAVAPGGLSNISAAIPQSTARRIDLDILASPLTAISLTGCSPALSGSKRAALAPRTYARDWVRFAASAVGVAPEQAHHEPSQTHPWGGDAHETCVSFTGPDCRRARAAVWHRECSDPGPTAG